MRFWTKREKIEHKQKISDVFFDSKNKVLSLRDRMLTIDIDKIKNSFFEHKILLKYSSIVLFIVLVSVFSLRSRADIANFYPTNCLGNWENPQNAEGVPDVKNNSDKNNFLPSNSAVLNNTNAPLYCGNFSGEIPQDAQAKKFILRFSIIDLDRNSENQNTVPINPVNTTDLNTNKSTPAIDSNTITPDQVPIPTPVLIPDPTSTSTPIPTSDSSPSPTPTPDTTNQNQPVSFSASNIFPKAFAQDISTVPNANDYLNVSYTINGTDWKVLGTITEANISDPSFEIPLENMNWSDIAKIQVSVTPVVSIDKNKIFYLDGMWIESDYDKADTAKALPTIELKNSKDVSVDIISGSADFSTNEDAVFEVSDPQLSNYQIAKLVSEDKATVLEDKDKVLENIVGVEPDPTTTPILNLNELPTTQLPTIPLDQNALSGATEIINNIIPSENALPAVNVPPPSIDNPADNTNSITTSKSDTSFLFNIFGKKVFADTTSQITATKVVDSFGNDTNIETSIENIVVDGKDTQRVRVKKQDHEFRPGKYSLHITLLTDTAIIETQQDFTWGVLVVNTNKSIYNTGDNAYLQMGVLDDQGHTICAADLKMDITTPSGIVTNFSTVDGTIVKDSACGPDNIVLTGVPDYHANFINTTELGIYKIKLIATTDNGVKIINDSFQVDPTVLFDVERVTSSRIQPTAIYPVTFNITANDDFSGTVIEHVPDSFVISAPKNSIAYHNTYEVNIDTKTGLGQEKIISWNLDFKKGETKTLGYYYNAPDISPDMFLLGPLEFFSGTLTGDPTGKLPEFKEIRKWQIASDSPPTSFSYKRTITIDHTKVPNTDQTNFPVLVDITDTALKTVSNSGHVTNSSGYDIEFFSAADLSGPKLSHEIELYDGSAGHIIMWVKLPLVTTASNTIFYMGYGNSGITTSQEDKTGLWSNYKGVWHLPNGTTLTANDSSGNGNNGILGNSSSTNPTATSAMIYGGAAFNDNNWVESGTTNFPTGSANRTLSGWIYLNSYPASEALFFGYGTPGTSNSVYELFTNTGHKLNFSQWGGSAVGATTLLLNTWYYVTCTNNGNNLIIYINGVQDGSGTATVNTSTGSMLDIGRFNSSNGSTRHLNGNVDEVKIANSQLSADWIKTEYNNQNSPSTFLTVSSEVTAYCTAITTGNWNDGTKWTGCSGAGGKPGTGDHVIINGGVTMTMNEDSAVLGNITINSTGVLDTSIYNYALSGINIDVQGTLIANGSIITLSGTSGTLFTKGGTFTSGTSTVKLSGSGTITVASGTPSFYNLTFSGTGTKSLAENLTATGTLTISAGTLDTTSVNNYTVNVGSILINGGTFTPQASTITISGTTSILFVLSSGTFTAGSSTVVMNPNADVSLTSGAITFNNLSLTPIITAAHTYIFGSGALAINGNFIINPTASSAYLLTVNMEANITVATTGTTTITGTTSATSKLVTKPSFTGATSFSYKRTITIDHTKVPNTDQSNFPVLVDITDNALKTVANSGHVTNANGYDIEFFTTSDLSGTKLSHEIELYDGSAGHIIMWVKLPLVTTASNTVFYMGYGNSSITTSQEDKTGLWSNYKGVWHLPNGTTLTANDSSGNGNNGTISGATSTSGKIDGAANFGGGSPYIQTSAFQLSGSDINKVTFSAWVSDTDRTARRTIYSGVNDNTGQNWEVEVGPGNGGSNTVAIIYPGVWVAQTSNGVLSDSNLHYIVYTRRGSGATNEIWIDGIQQSLVTNITNTFSDINTSKNIGVRSSASSQNWQGIIDEVRLSNVDRSPDWIKTEYNNQNSPSTFLSVGSESPTANSTSFNLSTGFLNIATGGTMDCSSSTSTIILSGTSGTLITLVGTFTMGTSTINLTGNGDATINSGAPTVYNLTSSGTGTKTMGANITIAGVFNITNGIFTASTFTLSLGGTSSAPFVTPSGGGSFSCGTGQVYYFGTNAGGITIESSITYYNLQVNQSTTTFKPNGIINGNVAGTLTITNGTLDTTSSNYAINFGKISIASATTAILTANASTITLNAVATSILFSRGVNGVFNEGTSSVIVSSASGSPSILSNPTTFHILTINAGAAIVNAGKQITFDNTAGVAFTANGSFADNGFQIVASAGTMTLGAGVTLCLGGNASSTSTACNGGNTSLTTTTMPSFSTFSFSSTSTVKYLADADTIISPTPIYGILILGPRLTAARTYTFASGTVTISNTTSSAFQIQPITGAFLLTVNMGGDITVPATATTTITGTTSTSSLITKPSSVSYNLNTGFLNIGTGGTLDCTSSSSGINLSGTSGTLFTLVGTFVITSGTPTVTLSGNGDATINSASIIFYNLTQTGGGIKSAGNAIQINNNLTISAGTFNPTATYTITGNGTNSLIVNNGGTIRSMHSTFAGDYASFETTTLNSGSTVDYFLNGTQTISNAISPYSNLTVSTGGTKTLGGDLTVASVMTIGTGATLDESSYNLTLSGTTGTPFVKTGTFIGNTGTITYSGNYASGNTNVLSTTYYNLVINNTAETYILGGATTVGNNLTITQGILDDGGYQITGNSTGTLSLASGTSLNLGSASVATVFPTNFTNAHISLNSASTVNDQAGVNQTISAIPNYGNLTISVGAIKSLSGTTVVNGNLNILAGSLDTVSGQNYALSVGGNWANSGTFIPQNGTVTLNSGTTANVGGGPTTFYNLTITHTGAKEVDFSNSSPNIIHVTHNFTVAGHLGQLIKLYSDSAGNKWHFHPTGTATVDYADVKDGGCESGAISISPTNSTDSHNNDACWIFSLPSSITFGMSGNAADLGILTPTQSQYATGGSGSGGSTGEVEAHNFTVTDTSPNGYSVSIVGQSLTDSISGHIISPIGATNTAPNPGHEQFGLRINASGGTGVVSSPYSGAGFAYTADATNASQICSASTGDGVTTTYSVRYLSNVAPTTNAGTYHSTLQYLVTGNF